MSQNTRNECRCEKKTCGCATVAAVPCTCGSECACERTCECGSGCGCGARKK